MSFFSAVAFLFKHRPTEQQVTSAENIAEAFKSFVATLEKEIPAIEGKDELLQGAHDLSVHATELLAAHVASLRPTELP